MFITCIDSCSKYLVVKEIQNKLNIETKIAEILQHFPLAKSLMIDNGPSFSSTQLSPSHKDAALIYISRILAIVRPMDK